MTAPSALEPAIDTRASWDIATRNHNRHKGDQAAFFNAGGDVLFPEELELLGALEGRSLVHLQCNAGQDSLCLARRGAKVTGVDFSSEAIRFARGLAEATKLAATFVEAELCDWMLTTEARYELAFSSYGAVGWMPDLERWASGVRRVLAPNGRFVLVEFHPLIWSFDAAAGLTRDDYFQRGPFIEPVGDYVADSGASLGAVTQAPRGDNPIPAASFQYGLAETVQALVKAGLQLERLVEWPYANGCKHPALVAAEGRRWVWPPGVARVPLMFGLGVRAPG
jgi:SAM-dependent methyltransferase